MDVTCETCDRLIAADEVPYRVAGDATQWFCEECWSAEPHDPDGHYVQAPGPDWRRWHFLFVPGRAPALH
jgi:hypothetical protein